MTDQKFDVSRRKVLGSLSLMGGGAVVGGTGTAALFNDREDIPDGTMAAGSLDLEVGWKMMYNGATQQTDSETLGDDPGPIFKLEDVKPGDCGEATIGLHVYDNPAWVHMGGELTANDDNGLTEPESDVDDTGGDGQGELADEILACAWYDGTDEDADGGNNEYDDGETQLTAGTLREVLSDLNDGVLLEDQTAGGGTVSGECREGPKTDREPNEGETISVGTGTVTITNVHYKEEDGEKEAIGFDWTSSGVSLCNVSIFGGNRTRNNEYDCATGGTALAPFNPNSGKLSGISHFTLHYCDGDAGGDDCFPNSTTQYIGFQWMLPRSVGNVVQSDSVEFDLTFHAQQCRHNDDPENPYS